MRSRRLAYALLVVGGLLTLVAVRHAWGRAQTQGSSLTIGAITAPVSGTVLTTGVEALAVLGLAGLAGVIGTRGAARALSGVVIALSGLGVLVQVVRVLGDLREQVLLQAGSCRGNCIVVVDEGSTSVAWLWPSLTLLGGLLLLVGGLLVVVRGRSWTALSAAYDAPAADVPEATTDKSAWDALDRGDDPTA